MNIDIENTSTGRSQLRNRAYCKGKDAALTMVRPFIFILLAFVAGHHFGSVGTFQSTTEQKEATTAKSKCTAHPKSVDEARANLAVALTDAWEVTSKDEKKLYDFRGVSAPRFMLNRFVTEVAKQQKQVGPVCMDWSSRYIEQFKGCTRVIDYQYHATERKYSNPTSGQMGLIQGDLGEDMSHVPGETLDFVIATQVFEHVPHFWNAFPNLARMMKIKSVLIFTVPWAYQFHPFPGDFYRYSPLAIHHLLESSGFAVCHFVSDGWRSLQMHSLGLNMEDIDKEQFLTEQSLNSKLIGASNYNVVAQRVKNIGDPCTLPKLKLTNELAPEDIKSKTDGFWPEPMKDFPFKS